MKRGRNSAEGWILTIRMIGVGFWLGSPIREIFVYTIAGHVPDVHGGDTRSEEPTACEAKEQEGIPTAATRSSRTTTSLAAKASAGASALGTPRCPQCYRRCWIRRQRGHHPTGYGGHGTGGVGAYLLEASKFYDRSKWRHRG